MQNYLLYKSAWCAYLLALWMNRNESLPMIYKILRDFSGKKNLFENEIFILYACKRIFRTLSSLSEGSSGLFYKCIILFQKCLEPHGHFEKLKWISNIFKGRIWKTERRKVTILISVIFYIPFFSIQKISRIGYSDSLLRGIYDKSSDRDTVILII